MKNGGAHAEYLNNNPALKCEFVKMRAKLNCKMIFARNVSTDCFSKLFLNYKQIKNFKLKSKKHFLTVLKKRRSA